MKPIKNWILGVFFGGLLAVMLTAPASAADLQKGIDAYEDEDYATAFVIFTLLAKAGDAEAQYRLGEMYDWGNGVEEDDAEAVKWHRLASEQGNAVGQNKLGWMYEKGGGVEQDYILAYMWYNLAAVQGNENGKSLRNNLAEDLTPEQITEAQKMTVRCFEQKYKNCDTTSTASSTASATDSTASAEDSTASTEDSTAPATGSTASAEDSATSATDSTASATDSTASATDFQKGFDAYQAEDYATALAIWTPLAEAENAKAQMRLGWMYAYGTGVERDYILAYMWLNLSAIKGDEDAKQIRDTIAGAMTPKQLAEAQEMTERCLAQEYKNCDTTSTADSTAPAENSTASAADGTAPAGDSTASAEDSTASVTGFQKGKDAYQSEDYATALAIWTPLAEAGDAQAQNGLGSLYFSGAGVERDDHLGYMWKDLAVQQGDEDAKLERDQLAGWMLPEQIAEAQAMAKKCLAQNYKNCDKLALQN